MDDAPSSNLGRILAGAVLVLAVGLAAIYVAWPSDQYHVRARFQAANQMIAGNLVMIAGHKVGIDKQFSPLRTGTEATIRLASLSGSVNRYIDLRIPPSGGSDIPEDGVI